MKLAFRTLEPADLDAVASISRRSGEGHRRLGIARALKLRVHEIAKAKGYREIRTSNTAPNKGMLALNDALGYVIVSSRGGYELELVSPPLQGC